jgi:hypothetical protein
VAAPGELERDLQLLASELHRLEGEYNMFFGGRAPRPPLETRARVEALLKRLDRAPFEQLAQRFRLQTLQSRYATFAELWDRTTRQREEGRPAAGATRAPGPPAPEPPQRDRVVHDARFDDAASERERLERLHAALTDARRAVGEAPVPFERFAALVREQLQQLRDDGATDVTFRVAISEGRVRLTARARRDARG